MSRLFSGTPFDQPQTCETCGEPQSACTCTFAQKQEAAAKQAEQEAAAQALAKRKSPQEQTAQVRIEKRKGNRKATVISGLTSEANDLSEILRQVQLSCGTGGTTKTDLIELQGDHQVQATKALKDLGFKIK